MSDPKEPNQFIVQLNTKTCMYFKVIFPNIQCKSEEEMESWKMSITGAILLNSFSAKSEKSFNENNYFDVRDILVKRLFYICQSVDIALIWYKIEIILNIGKNW